MTAMRLRIKRLVSRAKRSSLRSIWGVPMRIVLPSANQQLSNVEFDKCCQLVDYYLEEGKQIITYCTAHGRDSGAYDRGNVWQGGFVDMITKMLLSKKYNNINKMRLIGWHFSAYRLFDLASVVDPPANEWFRNFYQSGVDELPDSVDEIILKAIDPVGRVQVLLARLDAILNTVDHRYLVSQPLRFGEVAGEYANFFINGDSVRYWSTAAVLCKTDILKCLETKIAERGYCNVMEIGPGYGGLAYHLKKIYGDKIRIILVDLVESLIFSSMYLTTLFSDEAMFYRDQEKIPFQSKLIFVPMFRSPEFFDSIGDVDLCINTVSMNEMSADQVDYYGKKISRVLARDGVFFECNWMAAVAGPGRIDVKSYLALHFNDRLSVETTEVAGDGNLDLWANSLPPRIEDAARQSYGGSVVHYARA
jgi:hypothetical protein